MIAPSEPLHITFGSLSSSLPCSMSLYMYYNKVFDHFQEVLCLPGLNQSEMTLADEEYSTYKITAWLTEGSSNGGSLELENRYGMSVPYIYVRGGQF